MSDKHVILYYVRSILNLAGNEIITSASSVVYQLYSRACKCELISDTQKALIALNYCYSLITLNGSPPEISLKWLLLIQSHHKMKSSKSGTQ